MKALLAILSLLVFALPISAEELPQKGVLASTSNAGNGNVGSDIPWGSDGSLSGQSSPISASIARGQGDDWKLKVFNNSEDQYSVRLNVVMLGDGGKRIRTRPVSISLKPGGSVERDVRGTPMAKNCAVELSSWKRKASAKKLDELLAEIEEKKQELAELTAKAEAMAGKKAK